jgi:hypothetical protein
MTKATWRVKTLPYDEWVNLQNRFGAFLMANPDPDLAMFQKRLSGATDAEIFITGPGIEVIEAHSPGGWEDSGPPQGKGVALLAAASNAEHFGVELSL